jgi:prevent-host-death family protein
MCVTMLNMKTATVRDVQHHLAHVLRWVEDGEEVQITRRDRIVARLVPARGAKKPAWPDFERRLRRIWPGRRRGTPVSRLIIEGREDRM